MPETARTPIFNRYEILEELGEGAFGAVYPDGNPDYDVRDTRWRSLRRRFV